MSEYLQFWLAQHLIGLAIWLVFVVILFVCNIPLFIRLLRCKHEKYREDRACNAICCNCGRNLGFIQTLRDARKEGEA
ncbi:hypothetical protein [Pseudomonas multiresinivorans]|uniref:Uncharacterized protein n=1 Tax=Pseudomonas multiresinivorans TaxID=95301 RepID=A0A7Z3GRZ4_9PSED|nr:hypothetical protein [Pseudomonas multiresinivorans]QJP10471.1 hypothetical protein G4G71_22235 [Pseudomonas multiresinivorans]